MKFIFLYFIFFIFIISNKLFLFNEEFLILICFSIFCFIGYTKLSLIIQSRFNNKINMNESLMNESLMNLENNLINKHLLSTKIVKYKNLFNSLKIYYKNLSSKFLLCYLNYFNNLNKYNLLDKFLIFNKIEKDYPKLIYFLINKKINSVNDLFIFFNSILKIKKFKTLIKINRLLLIKKL